VNGIVALATVGAFALVAVAIVLLVTFGFWAEEKWKTIKGYRSAVSLQEACDRLSEENVALKAKIALLENNKVPFR
jgi:cell division protein FtsB